MVTTPQTQIDALACCAPRAHVGPLMEAHAFIKSGQYAAAVPHLQRAAHAAAVHRPYWAKFCRELADDCARMAQLQ